MYFFYPSKMSSCVGCSYPIPRTEILCRRCIAEEERVKWPQCHHCFQWTANCGESGYRLCYPCYHAHLHWLSTVVEPIQHLAKGYLARKLLKKHKSAKLIQQTWRNSRRSKPVYSVPFHAFCGGCGTEVNSEPPFLCSPCLAERA
jgi:hypothetical protein